jgi:signal transduction histidine kinase
VLLAWVNASRLQQLVTDRTGLQDTGELIVGAPDGQEVHLLLPPALDPSVTQIPLAGAIKLACVDMANGTTIEKDYRGVVVIAAYTPVGYENWGLVAKMSEHEAFRPVSTIRIVIIVAMTCILIAGIFASLVLAKLVTAPIIELGKTAAAIGGGDMTARVNIGRVIFRDEIDDLRLIFNSMVEEIAASHDAMEQKCAEVTRRTQDVALVNEALKKEIEERTRVEVELKKAKDAAQQADKMKSQFLANMSHEIRTPLNGIINCTELCLDTRTSPEQQEYLDLVRFSAKHLMRIITDILDFSKIEAGKLEMEDIQFSLYDQLEHAVSVLAARANKKGLELACQVDQSVPDQIIGDPGRLFQVFVNLIGNWLFPASCTLSFSSKHIIDVMPFIIIIFLSVGEFPICWMPLMDVSLLQAIA